MSASPLLAYHGDPRVKALYLDRVAAHAAADEILQSYGYWDKGRGCAIGCTVHVDTRGTAHARYPVELGIPEELAYLEDHFFENLPVEVAKQWPARFLSVITPGADLSRVYDLWSAWNLIDPTHGVITLVSDAYPDIQRIVRETGEACLSGDRVSSSKAAGAAWAAGAAEAAWAAEAAGAARAAGAAWAAWAARAAGAAGAAWAARAAWAAGAAGAAWAARAAEAAWAAGAAGAAYYQRAANELICLLETAPMSAAVSA